MHIRWREHEILFVTILVFSLIIESFLQLYANTNGKIEIDFALRFREKGIPFIYWKNVLLPQVGSVLMFYLAYLCINLLILPLIKKISFLDFEKLSSIRIGKSLLVIVTISYLLALGVNVCTYYAHPHLFNYNGYQFLALFGYNDKPLTFLFFGFDRALAVIILFTLFGGLRELIIWLISKPDAKREYKVLIANNITPLIFIYFLLLIYINPIYHDFLLFITCVTPLFSLYMYSTFWLFPQMGGNLFMERRFLIRLLLTTLVCTIPNIVFFGGNGKPLLFLLYWAFLLFATTPLCWLLYQQRKDKILQLRGVETALAKSNADLQFLRSQINPHFLFNSLNTLYGTALRENSEHTAQGIQKLGDMMRFMLHENNLDLIPMIKEIEYLKNYIELQKMRTQSSPDIIIKDNIDEVKCNCNIAPMLLIPFVENAFKHGISLKEKSWISIMLDCDDKAINFGVRNSTHLRSDRDTEKDKSGIGLKNVMDRLKLVYPNRHDLIVREDKNEFIIKLIIKR